MLSQKVTKLLREATKSLEEAIESLAALVALSQKVIKSLAAG